MSTRRDEDIKDLLARARGIHLTMTLGGITYQQAQQQTEPLLKEINAAIKVIAKKYKKRPKYIRFIDLGSRF